MENKCVVLSQRPDGIVKEEDFAIKLDNLKAIEEGEILIENKFISLDPAMRGWMNPGTTYIKGVEIGAVMRAFAAGQVKESKHPDFSVGDYVSGLTGAQQFAVSDTKGISKLNAVNENLSHHLGILGMPGMTAYFGLLEKGKPERGETVFISGAAGIVGSTVGQIAKIKGCQVVGTAGSAAKCKYLKEECGFDHAINYKEEDIKARLMETCPDGVHVFYDNVGGPLMDTVLTNLARGARVVFCGAISQYNNKVMYGPKNYLKIVTARGYMTGVIVFDFIDQYSNAIIEMSGWMKEGKLKTKEHIVKDLDNFPKALRMLFTGENFGKLVLQV